MNKLIKVKVLFDRGRNWIGYLTFLMLIFITISNMKSYDYIFGFLSGWHWMIILMIGALCLVLVLGYVEIRHTNAYQQEAEIYARLNPVQRRVFENQEKIIDMLDDIKNMLNKNE